MNVVLGVGRIYHTTTFKTHIHNACDPIYQMYVRSRKIVGSTRILDASSDS